MLKQILWKSLAKGVVTFFPGLDRMANSVAGSPVGARYFYSVWLRHLIHAHNTRKDFSFNVVAELGPGDALGLGISALLSGANRYIGLDKIPFGRHSENVKMLDELVKLFHARSPIPGDEEFPGVYPKLSSYDFPSYILSDARLEISLAPYRIEKIRNALSGDMKLLGDFVIGYVAPWDSAVNVQVHSVDFLISQAVMEHVDDIDGAYKSMYVWIKGNGTMSHRIDYSSHGITQDWFGHWLVPTLMWKIIRGRRAYMINRIPHSGHLSAISRAGFNVDLCLNTLVESGVTLDKIKIPLSDDDLRIKGSFMVCSPFAK